MTSDLMFTTVYVLPHPVDCLPQTRLTSPSAQLARFKPAARVATQGRTCGLRRALAFDPHAGALRGDLSSDVDPRRRDGEAAAARH